jgi:DNA-directed RNA polymerase specialized sigma24 family protein
MDNIFNWLTDNKSKMMNKFILGMIPNKQDAEDFYQDLYIVVADKGVDKMLKIYNNNEMEQYLYVIIRNNLMSVTSRYYYTYRKPVGMEYNPELDARPSFDNNDKFELLQDIENDYQALLKKINKYLNVQLTKNPNSFYDKEVFELYYNDKGNNTYRGLGDLLDIPPTSIYNTVKRNRAKIIKKFQVEIKNIKDKLIYYYTI